MSQLLATEHDLMRAAKKLINPGRALLAIVGAPGSGKSTLAGWLVSRLNEDKQGIAAQFPMDGFHLSNEILEELGLRQLKGSPASFDAFGFIAAVSRAVSEPDQPLYLPSYNRELHEPIAASIVISPSAQIVIIEGNYLLSKASPWQKLAPFFTQTWYIDEDISICKQRLVERQIKAGRTRSEAELWYESNDRVNVATVEKTRFLANYLIASSIP